MNMAVIMFVLFTFLFGLSFVFAGVDECEEYKLSYQCKCIHSDHILCVLNENECKPADAVTIISCNILEITGVACSGVREDITGKYSQLILYNDYCYRMDNCV